MRKKFIYTAILLAGSVLFFSSPAYAGGPQGPSLLNHPVALAMFAAQIVLLIIIAVLASKLLGRARFKSRVAQKIMENKSSAVMVILFLLLPSVNLFSQITTVTKDPVPTGSPTIGGMDPTSFYLMAAVLLVEIVVASILYFNIRYLKRTEEEEAMALAYPSLNAKPELSWWDRFNKLRPAEQEADIDLGHDYDGIRELDNRLPPWWLYGFYITIVFAGIYMWRYHVSHSAPLSKQEYERDVARAEAKINALLKSKGALVDENTVKLLTDPKDLNAGKLIYNKSCITCHKEDGRGDIGPNLTDDYWLNGGDLKSVFKIIRYGKNAMPPWQNAYSNSQIAQVTSYVKSLKGTNPPNAKPPQGELYKEEASPADSSKLKDNKATVPK